MSLKRLFSFFFLFINLSDLAFGQTGDNSPVVYDQFFQNYYLVNPAQKDSSEKINVSLGNRTLTGLFEGVNRFYVDANFLLSDKQKRKFHSFGLLMMNNREGDLFNRNRAYLRYSYRTVISDKSAISAGLATGFVNYHFKASEASGGGSDISPDINFGLWFIREKIQVGISYQQVLKPVLRPLNQEFTLPEYINLNIIHKLELSYQAYISSNLYYRYQTLQPFYIEYAPVFTFYDKLEIGANYRHERGVAVVAGIRSFEIGNNLLRFMASYLIITRKLSSFNDSVLEFSFGYSVASK